MIVFKKIYDGEDVYDLENDIIKTFNEKYEKNPNDIIFDEDGLMRGNFEITVKWTDV